jgi:alkyl hydroperoxide reductase subunit AhpC
MTTIARNAGSATTMGLEDDPSNFFMVFICPCNFTYVRTTLLGPNGMGCT